MVLLVQPVEPADPIGLTHLVLFTKEHMIRPVFLVLFQGTKRPLRLPGQDVLHALAFHGESFVLRDGVLVVLDGDLDHAFVAHEVLVDAREHHGAVNLCNVVASALPWRLLMKLEDGVVVFQRRDEGAE